MYPVIINAANAKGWKLVGNPSEKLGGKSCSNESLPSCNIHWVRKKDTERRTNLSRDYWQRQRKSDVANKPTRQEISNYRAALSVGIGYTSSPTIMP